MMLNIVSLTLFLTRHSLERRCYTLIEVNTYDKQVFSEISDELETRLSRAGELGRQTAYEKSRVDSSDMRNSTKYEVERSDTTMQMTLGQGNRQVDYAKFQELGTKFIEGTHHVKAGLQRAVEEFNK